MNALSKPAQNSKVEKRFRTLPEDSPERKAIAHPLLLTIAGISSGLLNTG